MLLFFTNMLALQEVFITDHLTLWKISLVGYSLWLGVTQVREVK